VPKVSQFLSSCGELFHTQGAVTENRRRQTQFYNEVQSAGLESMNGASALVGMSVSVSESYCGWLSVL